MEVHVSGEWNKDFEANRKRYARLGIPEYFLFDRTCNRLFGWRLPSLEARTYEASVPQQGRFSSEILGLDLSMEGDRVRFYFGTAPLPGAEELVAKLESMVDDLVHRREAEQRALALEREAQKRAEQDRQRAMREGPSRG